MFESAPPAASPAPKRTSGRDMPTVRLTSTAPMTAIAAPV